VEPLPLEELLVVVLELAPLVVELVPLLVVVELVPLLVLVVALVSLTVAHPPSRQTSPAPQSLCWVQLFPVKTTLGFRLQPASAQTATAITNVVDLG
jgi:hypothetical protein